MPITRLSLEEAAAFTLVEVAAVGISISSFTELGIGFDRASDDMDELSVAAFRIADKAAFAIMHYENDPKSDTTLMVEQSDRDPSAFVSIMYQIADELDFAPSAFYWQENGQTVRLPDLHRNATASA